MVPIFDKLSELEEFSNLDMYEVNINAADNQLIVEELEAYTVHISSHPFESEVANLFFRRQHSWCSVVETKYMSLLEQFHLH